MSRAWQKLWDNACGPLERDDMVHSAIDRWGEQIKQRLEEAPANAELVVEINCLEWIFRRHVWIITLRWRAIDQWIRAHFPNARKLPRKWSFTHQIKKAFTEKVMTNDTEEV